MPTDRLSAFAFIATLAPVAAFAGASCAREEPPPAATPSPPAPTPPAPTPPPAADKGPRHEEIHAAIDVIRDRHACNRVTGCPGLVALFQYGPELIAPAAEALARPDRGDGHWTIVLTEALGQLDDARAAEPLVALLSDRRWDIRVAAAIGLGHLGQRAPPAARAELQRLAALPDNEPGAGGDLGFRAALEFALARVDPERARAHRETLRALVPQTRAQVLSVPAPILDVLVNIVGHARLTEALPGVRNALATDNRFVVASALAVAGRLKDSGAIMPIIDKLDDRNPTIRKLANAALGEITGASFEGAGPWRAWAARVGVPGAADPPTDPPSDPRPAAPGD